MDHHTLQVAHEFAVYDDLFDHIDRVQDLRQATAEERLSANPEHEKLLKLYALFVEAVVRSELKEADVQRLIASKERVVGEAEKLFRRLAEK